MPEDEKNLLYVAITRAKTNLVMNDLRKFELLEEYLLRLSTYVVTPSPKVQHSRGLARPIKF